MFKYATLLSAALMSLASGSTLTRPLSDYKDQREDIQAIIRVSQSGAGYRRPRSVSSKIMMRQTTTVSGASVTPGTLDLLYTLKRLNKNGNYEFRVINDPDYDLNKCEKSANVVSDTVITSITADAKGKAEDAFDMSALNMELFDDSIDGVDDNKETILNQVLLLIEVDPTKTNDYELLRACGAIERNGNSFANRYRLKWLDQLDD